MCAPGHGVATWPAPDWVQPWYAPYAGDGASVRAACEAGEPLPKALTRRVGVAGPRFVVVHAERGLRVVGGVR